MHRLIALSLALAACSAPGDGTIVPDPTPSTAAAAPQPTPAPTPDGYVGRWTGVEGMFADIAPAAAPGRYRVTMRWDLDHEATFEAWQTPMELGLDFYRNGELHRLEPSSGDRIGLKYLAGKTKCLMVKPGEGYCRD